MYPVFLSHPRTCSPVTHAVAPSNTGWDLHAIVARTHGQVQLSVVLPRKHRCWSILRMADSVIALLNQQPGYVPTPKLQAMLD